MWEPIFVLLGEQEVWEELIWLVSVERLLFAGKFSKYNIISGEDVKHIAKCL